MVECRLGKVEICLNKQLLVDGYALVSPHPQVGPFWDRYQQKARSREVGLWSEAGRWVVPKVVTERSFRPPGITDRDQVIERYGIPDFSRREKDRNPNAIMPYGQLIKDFYVRHGLVFIYRNGRLITKEPYQK